MLSNRFRVVLLCGAGLIVVSGIWLSAAQQATPSAGYAYAIDRFHTQRGRITPLPAGNIGVHSAQLCNGGNTLLIQAYALGKDDLHYTSCAWWILDRVTGRYEKIHENVGDDSTGRFGLRRLGMARISPDGRWLTGIRSEYSEEFKTVDRADDAAAAACLKNAVWVAWERATGRETLLKDLTEERRAWAASALLQTPHEMLWVDSGRIAFTRHAPDGRPSGTIYTLDVSSGRIDETIREAPGADAQRLRYVGDGRFIYCVQDAAGLERYLSASPQDRSALVNEGLVLKLADVRGQATSTRVLPIRPEVAELRDGILSPDEKYYAFVRGDAVSIVNVENGKIRRLENEHVAIYRWHPDGKKLLGYMSAIYPQDPPGVLVEIPVEDVLAALE